MGVLHLLNHFVYKASIVEMKLPPYLLLGNLISKKQKSKETKKKETPKENTDEQDSDESAPVER